MSKIKKIIPIITGITIVLSTIFILSENVYAAISSNFAKKAGIFEKKSIAGIYYAMRTGREQWVKATAPKGEELSGWANEYGADSYDFKDNWDDYFNRSNYGVVAGVGGLCFGHQYQGNSTANSKIYVYDVTRTSNADYHYLGYNIYKSIENKENGGTNVSWKSRVRDWIFKNFKGKIQTADGSTRDYTEGEGAESYVNYITNISNDIVNNEKSSPTITYKGEDTFIGPYSIKVAGKNNWTRLTEIDINGETNIDTNYYSTDGNTIRNISDFSFNREYNNFYIVVKGQKISSVNSITINKEYDYYRARLVASEPKGDNGQNIAVFYGYKDSEDIAIDLPGVPYGSLQIKKIDKDTGETLTGIGFKVYSQAEAAWLKLDENSNIAEYTTFDEASVIDTKEKGETAKIEQMPVGKYDIYETYLGPYDNIYKLDEINVPGKDEKVNAKLIEKDYQISGTKILECQNKQEYVSLSGYVWVDKISGKQLTIDNIYNDSDDELLDGITVRLKDKTTGEIVKKTITANEGKYLFTDVLVEELENYYIEFEYDGLTYTNVVPNLDLYETDENGQYKLDEEGNKIIKTNGSKAIESSVDRDDFNKGFSVVEGESTTTGITKIDAENKKHDLEYDVSEHKAELKNTKLIENDEKTAYKLDYIGKEKYLITANTDEANYSIEKHFVPGEEEIKYINLGLYIREQPDISLVKDLDSVNLSINGYNNIYNYAQRFKEDYQPTEEDLNVGVKYKDKYTGSYYRAIYKADYIYNDGDTTENSKNLKVYLTYKIRLINETSGLKVKVNSIVDYFDKDYTLKEVGTKIDEKGTITEKLSDDQISEVNKHNDEYSKATITTDTEIEPQGMSDIYVQFELNREAILKILGTEETPGTGETLDNVAEINSYSVFDENGKVYSGIDKDSNPGNAVPGEPSTYEDDTDSAPSLQLEVAEARKMTGKVFLDSSDKIKEGEREGERLGDGEYKEGEKGIEGVQVTLTETKGTNQVYKATTGVNGDFLIKDYIPGDYTLTYTWGDETYAVQNYKGTIWTQENQNQKAEKGEQWYKETEHRYTDAKDDYIMRGIIDSIEDTNRDGKIDESEIKPYENRIQQVISGEIELTEEREYRMDINQDGKVDIFDVTKLQQEYTGKPFTMDSTTPLMGIGVENVDITTSPIGNKYEFTISNIDFGIVERAKQEIEIEKKVNSVEITLANGQTIASLKYNDKGEIEATKGIVYIPASPGNDGMIKAELDNELIQGATVNIQYGITVANNSEVDYDTKDYYLYGTKGTESQIIRYIPSEIYDYLDNTLAVEQNDNWIVKEISTYNSEVSEPTVLEDYLYKYNSISTDSTGNKIEYEGYESFKEWYNLEEWNMSSIQESRKTRLTDKTILYHNNEEIENVIKAMKPGDDEVTLAILNVSKVLTNTDDISLNNDVEITKVTHKGDTGRRLTVNNLYDSGETVTITPPTGESTDYILISTLGITFLITLATGIVFIKKKILK